MGELPNLKLLHGRPVASLKDLIDFCQESISEGQPRHRKGEGVKSWKTLLESKSGIQYIAGQPAYATRQVLNRIQYFDCDTAREAGLEAECHIDLYSLYSALPELFKLIRQGERLPPESNLGPGRLKIFLDFLNAKLDLDPPLEA